MSKIEVNKVAEILKRNELDPALLRTIVEEMNLLTQPEVDEEKPPAEKKQFCVIVSDPDNQLRDVPDLVCWVVQIPESEAAMTALERLHKGVYDFNTTKKGRLMPVKTVGEAMEHVPAKHFKECGVWIKTRTPVLLLRSNNEIPKEVKE